MRQAKRGRSAVLLALLAGAAGSLASCGFIVGVGDYKVGAAGDAEADATADEGVDQGGDVGPDRVDTGGGGDGKMGDTAAEAMEAMADVATDRGDAGTDQGTGSDGDGAVSEGAGDADAAVEDSDAGAMDTGPNCGQTIPSTTSDFQTLVSTCVLAVSCDPYLFPLTLSECISENALQSASAFRCLSTITSCSGTTNSFYSCEGVRFATMSECPGLTSTCDTVNQVAIDCNFTSITGIVTNCALTPLTSCQIYDDSGTSSTADCVVADPCSLANGGGCSRNSAFTCIPNNDAGIGVGHYCGNATCVPSTGGALCQYTGAASCTDAGSASCNGNTLAKCEPSGQEFDYDCTRSGGSCETDDAGSSGCVSPGCQVSSTCVESCSPSTGALSVCVGGAAYAVDCTHYGFGSCGNTGSAVYCTP